jgi:hypothetical protein
VNFSHSLYWGGISAVTIDGKPMAPGSFTITSESGLDYTQSFVPTAVPEPGHYAGIAGAALLGFALWRRSLRAGA